MIAGRIRADDRERLVGIARALVVPSPSFGRNADQIRITLRPDDEIIIHAARFQRIPDGRGHLTIFVFAADVAGEGDGLRRKVMEAVDALLDGHPRTGP